MKVDPEQLRALAASMDHVGTQTRALDVRAKADAVSSVLAGSPLGEACATAGEQVQSAFARLATRCERMSGICQGSAGTYEVTDSEFHDRLAAIGHGVQ